MADMDSAIKGISTANARKALTILADVGRVKDRELGAMLGGKSRQTGLAKRHGDSDISLDDIDMLAHGLDVEAHVFLMEEFDVYEWIEENDWRGPKRVVDLHVPKRSCDARLWLVRPTDDRRRRRPVVEILMSNRSPASYAKAS